MRRRAIDRTIGLREAKGFEPEDTNVPAGKPVTLVFEEPPIVATFPKGGKLG